MKTITICEKSMGVPIVDASNGEDIGSSSIPLFLRDSLAFTYLVINQGKDDDSTQLLVCRTDIVSWNAYAIAVEMPNDILVGDDTQLSPDEYVELLGLQTRFEDGIVCGNVVSVSVEFASGAIRFLTVQSGDELQTFESEQIISLDSQNVITLRDISQSHVVCAEETAEDNLAQQSETEVVNSANDTETLDVVADHVEVDHQEASAEPIQTLPLIQAVAEPVVQEKPQLDACVSNEQMEQLMQRLTQIGSRWEQVTVEQAQSQEAVSETFEQENVVTAPMDEAPSVSTEENVVTKTHDKMETLELKRQVVEESEEEAEDTTRIRLGEVPDNIFDEQMLDFENDAHEEVPLSVAASEDTLAQDVSASITPITPAQSQSASQLSHAVEQPFEPMPKRVLTHQHTSNGRKVYWKTSGSQVLGMTLFVAVTIALSLLQIL